MEHTNSYPATVARDIEALRPDLTSDAIRAVLTNDPSLTAGEAIEILDQASYDAAFELAYEALCERQQPCGEQDRKSWGDALNNVWVEGITVDEWVRLAAERIGV